MQSNKNCSWVDKKNTNVTKTHSWANQTQKKTPYNVYKKTETRIQNRNKETQWDNQTRNLKTGETEMEKLFETSENDRHATTKIWKK